MPPTGSQVDDPSAVRHEVLPPVAAGSVKSVGVKQESLAEPPTAVTLSVKGPGVAVELHIATRTTYGVPTTRFVQVADERLPDGQPWSTESVPSWLFSATVGHVVWIDRFVSTSGVPHMLNVQPVAHGSLGVK